MRLPRECLACLLPTLFGLQLQSEASEPQSQTSWTGSGSLHTLELSLHPCAARGWTGGAVEPVLQEGALMRGLWPALAPCHVASGLLALLHLKLPLGFRSCSTSSAAQLCTVRVLLGSLVPTTMLGSPVCHTC